jgi:hypothetical protein
MQLSRLLITVSAVTAFALLPEGNSTKAASKPSLTAKDIENMMTSLSNWGRWGKQDELGAFNLITPQKRKSAAAEVKEGVAVSMANNAIKVATEGSPAFEHKMTATGQDKSTGASDAYAAQYHGYSWNPSFPDGETRHQKVGSSPLCIFGLPVVHGHIGLP